MRLDQRHDQRGDRPAEVKRRRSVAGRYSCRPECVASGTRYQNGLEAIQRRTKQSESKPLHQRHQGRQAHQGNPRREISSHRQWGKGAKRRPTVTGTVARLMPVTATKIVLRQNQVFAAVVTNIVTVTGTT